MINRILIAFRIGKHTIQKSKNFVTRIELLSNKRNSKASSTEYPSNFYLTSESNFALSQLRSSYFSDSRTITAAKSIAIPKKKEVASSRRLITRKWIETVPGKLSAAGLIRRCRTPAAQRINILQLLGYRSFY